MGRSNTGAWSVGESLRIELSSLLKDKIIRKGHVIKASINWSNGGSIGITTSNTEDGKYIDLRYNQTDREGNATNYDYRVWLTSVPSNLGKGEILYFCCPVSGERCRILYSAYGYPKFKSREAYTNRLYYNCQWQSKNDYWNTRYHDTKVLLEKLKNTPTKRTYKGKPTKHQRRIDSVRGKLNYYDRRSCSVFFHQIQKMGLLRS
jgi:hypothetical protein